MRYDDDDVLVITGVTYQVAGSPITGSSSSRGYGEPAAVASQSEVLGTEKEVWSDDPFQKWYICLRLSVVMTLTLHSKLFLALPPINQVVDGLMDLLSRWGLIKTHFLPLLSPKEVWSLLRVNKGCQCCQPLCVAAVKVRAW